jgi:hypothetical protein
MANRLRSRIEKLQSYSKGNSDKVLFIFARPNETEKEIKQRIADKLNGKPEPELIFRINWYGDISPDI